MKKIFNPKLYIDGLKQLLLGGSILFFVTTVITLLPPISELADGYPNTPHTVDPVIIAPVLFAFMFVGGFVLPYTLFKFVNKRNSSDFYDGLPNSHLATFTSLSLAAFTWIAGIITANMIVGTLAWLACGCSIINFSHIFMWWIYFIIGTFIAAACTLTSMSITGTILSNFITAGIIMFLPRIILIFCQVIIIQSGSILTYRTFSGITHPANNFLVSVPLSLIYGYNPDYSILRPYSYIYSIIILIIVLAAAAFLFTRRKSENAEKSAPNKILQHIYRCCLTLPFTLLVAYVALTGQDYGLADDFVLTLSLIAISCIVYFVYEAITTRSLKKVIKSIPLFFIILGISVGLAFTSSCIGNTLMKKVPKSENIVSVGVKDYTSYSWDNDSNYYKNIISDIKFQNEELTESVLDALRTTIDTPEINRSPCQYTVTFYLKNGGVLERIICLNETQKQKVDNAKTLNQDYSNSMRSTMDEVDVNDISGLNLTESESMEVYKALKEDLKEIPMEDVESVIRGSSSFGLFVQGTYNNRYSYADYSLIDAPKATAKYLEITSNKESMEKSIDFLSKRVSTDSINYYNTVAISGLTDDFGYGYMEIIPDQEKKEFMDNLYSILKKGAARTPSDRYIPISVDFSSSAYPTDSNADEGLPKAAAANLPDISHADMNPDGSIFGRSTVIAYITADECEEILNP